MIIFKKKINWFLLWLCILEVTIFIISMRFLPNRETMGVWDEMGYWGVGAYIAGYDWSSIVSTFSGYYSFGYSFLLAFLMRIFSNAVLFYKAAIILNGIFLMLSFYFAYDIGRKVFNKNNKLFISIIAFISVIFGNNIMQSSFAWSETLLTFLFWLLIWIFLSIDIRPSNYKFILVALISAYCYYAHQRMLGVLVASMITVIVMAVYKRISIQNTITYLFIIVILMFAGNCFKEVIQNNVWKVSEDASMVNDYSSLTSHVFSFSTWSGVLLLIKSFICRIYYWGCTTYLMGFFLLRVIIQKCYYFFIRRESYRMENYFIFLSLSLACMVGELTIAHANNGTHQGLLYGRYQDTLSGPILLFGIIYFCNLIKENKKVTVYFYAVIILVMCLMRYCVESTPVYYDYYVANCNVQLYRWYRGYADGYDMAGMLLISFNVAILLFVINFTIEKQFFINTAWIVLSVLFLVKEISASNVIYEITMREEEHYLKLKKVSSLIEQKWDEEEIYFYINENHGLRQPLAMNMQLLLFDRKIICVNNIGNLTGELLLVPYQNRREDNSLRSLVEDSGYKEVTRQNYIALYTRGESKWTREEIIQ